MFKFNCQHASTSDSEDQIQYVAFNEDHDDDIGSYVLISRAFFEEEDEDDEAPIYVETHDQRLIGYYQTVGAELNRDSLTLTLPAPTNQTMKIDLMIPETTFQKVSSTLDIILRRNA